MTLTSDTIRELSGAPTELIDDTKIQNILSTIETKTSSYFGIRTKPTQNIELVSITDPKNIKVKKTPVLSLDYISINNNELNLSDVKITRSGNIRKTGSNTFFQYGLNTFNRQAKVKYTYGWVEENEDTINILDTTISSGNSQTITLNDSTDFNSNDYISIEDFNGYKEITKIISVSGNDITVNLKNSYNGDIKIVKLDTPKIIQEYIKYETCMAVALNAVGGTYTFNTSYSKGDLSTTKGVPYPHWEKSFNSNQKLRDEVLNLINDSLIISS